jgi:alpha-tubulin suppressor-like RCC1 family protein
MSRNLSLLSGIFLVAVAGCQDEIVSPAPESEPALAATATAALAFYQVSVGSLYTCGVTTDNRAYCWGDNTYGRLGDGSTTRRLGPYPVATTLRFRQISAGDGHTCAVALDQRAYCWGFGRGGALGDGTNTDRRTPVLVAGGRLFRQVDVGDFNTCGVSYPDNRAYCWGYNGSGGLGDATTTTRPKPVAVSGDRQFRQVEASAFHTCGVTTLNQAFCWGSNEYGKLGDGVSTVGSRKTPVAVAGTRRFLQVSTGSDHTCGVTTDNRAFCWGRGIFGQSGYGDQKLSYVPRPVAGGLFFERVSAGFDHTCAETTGNRAYCWGGNGNGQLGYGTTGGIRLTPVAVAGGHFFAQVSAGQGSTCGRTSGAVAYCWGTNLGNGTTNSSPVPTRVSGG